MKTLTRKKIWQFAFGQLGWSLLSGIISNWLVYFYQPDAYAIENGQTVFIPQGLVILGIFTIIGAITAFGRIFDAITDPLIASASDRCQSKNGRRIPFMKWAALPLALSTVLVFWSPVDHTSWSNAWFLFAMVMLFYLSLTAYCTPYNALIPEMGRTQHQRMSISTTISFTFIMGTAVAYLAPVIWGMFEGSLGRDLAVRLTFSGMAIIALICLLIPVFTINEKEYAHTQPSQDGVLKSLAATFKNKEFLIYAASDIFYWIAMTMFQTGLPFFVTALLQLPESMTTVYFIGMTAVSLLFYLPINKLADKWGKKKVLLMAFGIFTCAYAYTGLLGKIPFIPPVVQGGILTVAAALPMAAFGIIPTAVVADIAQSDANQTKSNREGMFYAARTFAFKMGQSVSMLLFTAISTIGTGTGEGYRLAAFTAAFFCLLGAVTFAFYNEKKVNAGLGNES